MDVFQQEQARIEQEYEEMRQEFDIGFYIVGILLVFFVLHISGVRNKAI